MAGRKTKLTKSLIEEASKLVKAGNYNETVCQYLGIHKSTWYKWLQAGEDAKSGLKREFFDSIKKAEAHAEMRNVEIIQRAAYEAENDPRLWTAAMAFLERKHPEKWGKKEKFQGELEHSGELVDKKKVEVDITQRIDQYEDIYRKVAQREVNIAEDD